jgi:hypothetical protein
MNKFFVSAVACLVIFSNSSTANGVVESSPLNFVAQQPACCSTSWISEIGMSFPVKTTTYRDFLTSSGVITTPITSGMGYGVQFGRHYVARDGATLGVVVAANAFYSNTPATNQVYQVAAYFTGRAYFSQSWHEGIFAEIGAGPEVGGTSINSGDFRYQANLSARFGLGYNYRFNDDVSIGLSVVASPSVMSSSIVDGSRVLVNMLW